MKWCDVKYKVFSDTEAFFQDCKKGNTAKSYMCIHTYNILYIVNFMRYISVSRLLVNLRKSQSFSTWDDLQCMVHTYMQYIVLCVYIVFVAPNFHGQIFSWFLWITQKSWKFLSQSILMPPSMKQRWIVKICLGHNNFWPKKF